MISGPYKIEWRPLAREDLKAIVRFIGQDSPARARTFGQQLKARIDSLATSPKKGRPSELADIPGLRELVAHPNYIALYRVVDDLHTVQILRIKHAARQWP